MPPSRNSDTRQRLLVAAADLISAHPGQDVPLRAICDRAGVKLPTLYHFFGSKAGLVDAVIEHGFALYTEVKGKDEGSGDPVRDIRAGWDAHVAFGLANPGFYALMYGQVTPGRQPAAQQRPTDMLRAVTVAAAEQGRLVVDPDQAAAHVLAANVGVTLRQITAGAADPELSVAVRESTIAAITGLPGTSGLGRSDLAAAALGLLSSLPADDDRLGSSETALLRDWLLRLAEPPESG